MQYLSVKCSDNAFYPTDIEFTYLLVLWCSLAAVVFWQKWFHLEGALLRPQSTEEHDCHQWHPYLSYTVFKSTKNSNKSALVQNKFPFYNSSVEFSCLHSQNLLNSIINFLYLSIVSLPHTSCHNWIICRPLENILTFLGLDPQVM